MYTKNDCSEIICGIYTILLIVVAFTSILYADNYNGNLKQTNCEILESRLTDLSNDTLYCGQFRTTIKNDDTFCGNMSNIWVKWDCTEFSDNVKELKRKIHDELKIGKIYKNCYYDNVDCDSVFLEEKDQEIYFKMLVVCGYIFITITSIITVVFCIISLDIKHQNKTKERKERRERRERREQNTNRIELDILIPVSAPVLPPPPPYNNV